MWKSKSNVFASILITMVTFLILSLSIMTFVNVNNISKSVASGFTIRVIVNADIKDETESGTENARIKAEILKTSNVTKVTFISKTDDLKNLIEANKNENGTSPYDSFVNNNPLGNVFDVTVADQEQIAQTASEINKISGVYRVAYLGDEVAETLRVAQIINYSLIAFFILLVIAAILLIANVIKLSINQRKDEIEIMRLVGASNQYIKNPFIAEGIIISLFSGLVVAGLMIFLYNSLLAGKPIANIEGATFVPTNQINTLVLGATTILSFVVGYFGSNNAIKRYLKI
jgi:cell division transport system permease protein